MGGGSQLLSWLAEAGVPAFLCRRDGDRLVFVAATPALTDADASPAYGLAEAALLTQVESAWAQLDSSPMVIQFAGVPDVQCVLQTLDDTPDACLGIVQVSSDRQRYNDSFYAIVEQLPDIIARFDRKDRHLFVNRAMERIVGQDPQMFIGKNNAELGMPAHLVQAWESLHIKVFETREPAELEFVFETQQGPRHFLCRVVPEFAADGNVRTILSTSHDITELKSLQQQLAMLASTDPLTSLLNRRGFVESLEAQIVRARSGKGQLSLLMIDVDQFKVVNDTFGHLAGDNVLLMIGDILRQETRATDFVARLGGDEFYIGLVDADGAEARDIADRIHQRVRSLGSEGLSPCAVSVSIGLAVYADTDRSGSDLIARVDEAMYREKSRGAQAQ